MKTNILTQALEYAANTLSQIFLTPHCISCGILDPGASGGYKFLCKPCYLQVPLRNSIICPSCGRRVVFGVLGGSSAHATCKKRFPFFLLAATNYENHLIRNILHAYKYGGVASLHSPLKDLFLSYMQIVSVPAIESYVTIPVPLHAKKEKSRGFNQSQLIAEQVADTLGIPLLNSVVIRQKNTRTQAKLNENNERVKNLKNGFIVTNKKLISGANCLIIDDIYTSGATINELATTLKRAGAKRIIAGVIAKS